MVAIKISAPRSPPSTRVLHHGVQLVDRWRLYDNVNHIDSVSPPVNHSPAVLNVLVQLADEEEEGCLTPPAPTHPRPVFVLQHLTDL